MSNSALVTQLRKKALETLYESSELFEKVTDLLKDGKLAQADELQEQARQKRLDSILLMTQANKLEQDRITDRTSA
jgi:DNA-binding protein H-NS